jgi:hypothetical protein
MRESFDLGVAGGRKALDRGFVDALEEQDAGLVVGHAPSLGRT